MKNIPLYLLSSIICALLIFPANAQAEFRNNLLNSTASSFAQRPVQVSCKTEAEDANLIGAWGYVFIPLAAENTAHVHETVCIGALAIALDAVDIPDWKKSLGVEVIVHEAFHLKIVPQNLSEMITECRAFRHYDKGFLKLGASKETLDRLMPLAIARHFWFVTTNDTYNYRQCSMPDRFIQWLEPPDKVMFS